MKVTITCHHTQFSAGMIKSSWALQQMSNSFCGMLATIWKFKDSTLVLVATVFSYPVTPTQLWFLASITLLSSILLTHHFLDPAQMPKFFPARPTWVSTCCSRCWLPHSSKSCTSATLTLSQPLFCSLFYYSIADNTPFSSLFCIIILMLSVVCSTVCSSSCASALR